MSSHVGFTLEELDELLSTMQTDSESNVTWLEQAVEAMRQGKVGASVLGHYSELMDLTEAIRDAAHGLDADLEPNRQLRDVRMSFPDAGDNAFLAGD